MLFLIPVSSFAQGGGHVGFFGRIFGPGQQQQQQQQQRGPIDFYKVIRGEEAKSIYESLLTEGKAKEVIMDQNCSEPVTRLHSYYSDDQYYDCFDRGDAFTRSSRYKCYKQIMKNTDFITGVRAMFRIMPKECGGDGIYPVNRS